MSRNRIERVARIRERRATAAQSTVETPVGSMVARIASLSSRSRSAVCERFESLEELLTADTAELLVLRGVGVKLAERITETARSTITRDPCTPASSEELEGADRNARAVTRSLSW
jgi:ERCC4-type nuclease